jgi:hypothetical protein
MSRRRSANPEKVAAVEAIASALRRLQPDEVLPYDQINNAMLGDRNLLYRARREVERSHGYAFGTVRNEGIKRLSRRIVIVDAAITKIGRVADRTEDHVASMLLNDASISREEKAQLNSSVAHINAVQWAIKLAKG